MKFASWNINSINIRLEHLVKWIKENEIDVICLQEIKSTKENFPLNKLKSENLNIEFVGQKSYNGVAIISNKPIKFRRDDLPSNKNDNPQARYLEVEIEDTIFSSIYLPNGNPINSDKLLYKIDWMKNLIFHSKNLLKEEKKIILAGDYNVIPKDIDCWDPKFWKNDALALLEIRKLYRELCHSGFYDAFRVINKNNIEWTFWDYQGGAWNKDYGIRIDHLMLNSFAIDKLKNCKIDKSMRGIEKPSDHVPIWGELLN